MPPRAGSRYLFCTGIVDEAGVVSLSEREPYRYRALPDTRLHTAREGDSLWSLAGAYFRRPRACGFWWVIADFQPDPVIDGTLRLEPGRIIHIPSDRVLDDVILGEGRRRVT